MDPFVPDDNTGYTPEKFYTNHGDRPSDAVEVNIKMDPLQRDRVFKMFIAPEDRFGQYKGMSDFIADAIAHRMHWLMTEYPHLDTPENRRQDAVMLAAFSQRTLTTTNVTRMETMRRLQECIDRSADTQDWADQETLVTLLEEGKALLATASDQDKAKLLVLIADGFKKVGQIKEDGQLSLSDSIDYVKEVQSLEGMSGLDYMM